MLWETCGGPLGGKEVGAAPVSNSGVVFTQTLDQFDCNAAVACSREDDVAGSSSLYSLDNRCKKMLPLYTGGLQDAAVIKNHFLLLPKVLQDPRAEFLARHRVQIEAPEA